MNNKLFTPAILPSVVRQNLPHHWTGYRLTDAAREMLEGRNQQTAVTWDGYPENRERDGVHWFFNEEYQWFTEKWDAGTSLYGGSASPRYALRNKWQYKGPALTPDQVLEHFLGIINEFDQESQERRWSPGRSYTEGWIEAIAGFRKKLGGLQTTSQDGSGHPSTLQTYNAIFTLERSVGMSISTSKGGWLSWSEVKDLSRWLINRVKEGS